MRVMKNKYKPMTVKEIADEMKQSPAKVYYHIKKLESIGVLYIKYTKVINGIVAKYYDFATDSVSLSIQDDEEGMDIIRSKMMSEYGQYFDEAKQKFLNSYNNAETDKPMNDKDVFMSVKDSFPVDPERVGDMYDEIREIFTKYHSDKENAVRYSTFMFMIQNGRDE